MAVHEGVAAGGMAAGTGTAVVARMARGAVAVAAWVSQYGEQADACGMWTAPTEGVVAHAAAMRFSPVDVDVNARVSSLVSGRCVRRARCIRSIQQACSECDGGCACSDCVVCRVSPGYNNNMEMDAMREWIPVVNSRSS